MFKVKNLILACDSCNNLKNAEQVLSEDYIGEIDLPDLSEAYLIFNPHFDEWQDHLAFEDDIFIVAVPDSKGRDTIRVCHLYRYNVIVNRAKELKLGQKGPAKKLMHRLSGLDPQDQARQEIVTQILKAVDYFFERIDDIPGF
jgi:hypothetical protein